MKTTNMTSREIITRVIRHEDTPRIGFDFDGSYQDDIIVFGATNFVNNYTKYSEWGKYPELLAKTNGFRGEVKMGDLGTVWGRLGNECNGECVYAPFQDGWDLMEQYQFPEFNEACKQDILNAGFGASDKFVVGVSSISAWDTLAFLRTTVNALMDLVLEPEYVKLFLEKVKATLLQTVDFTYKAGAQAFWIYDDIGTQSAPMFSKDMLREYFLPVYKMLGEAVHERGMKLFLHACGNIWNFIPEFIDAGVDVFQFDQMELYGSENLAKAFGKKTTMFAPVDIQKVMATGDREYIEATARNMVRVFKEYGDGALIAHDYPQWEDIHIKAEWADWARNVFLEEGWY